MTAACSGSRSRRSEERRGTKPCRSVLPPKKEETLLVKLEEITDVWNAYFFYHQIWIRYIMLMPVYLNIFNNYYILRGGSER
jgi:hypothetical protein